MPFTARVKPRFDYGRSAHTVSMRQGQTVFDSPDLSLALTSSVPVEIDGPDATSSFLLGEGSPPSSHSTGSAAVWSRGPAR